MKNIKTTILYLATGYLLPLSFRWEMLGHYKIWILMAACMVMLLFANPPISLRENGAKRTTDRNTMLLIFLLGYISIVAPIIEWAYFKTDHGWTAWTTLGLLLITGGLSFRIWAMQVLGRFFTGSVQQVEGHQLVTVAPYAWLRHPSYTGSLVTFLGCAVLLEAWTGLAVNFTQN